jgi:hypothetical protein
MKSKDREKYYSWTGREREEEDPLRERVRAIYLRDGAIPDRVSSNNSSLSKRTRREGEKKEGKERERERQTSTRGWVLSRGEKQPSTRYLLYARLATPKKAVCRNSARLVDPSPCKT